jgi:hypothetical protein
MLSISLRRLRVSRAPWSDLLTITFLIGLDAAARLLPHAPDFTPVAATALFAASVLRLRTLAVIVPILGMMLGDAVLGFYDLRLMTVVYVALALPACTAFLSSRFRRPRLLVSILLSSSLLFFLVTNLAVWAFGSMYAADAGGLLKCYVAALPFLRNMLAGDLFWGLILFGGYWLAQTVRAATTEQPTAQAGALSACA